ncbi:MAG TPA: hypothetical protein VER12_11595, partial [Polyangiaceae bacterium]|nr:hypothetical protein [Polyangiaceae bacterium]
VGLRGAVIAAVGLRGAVIAAVGLRGAVIAAVGLRGAVIAAVGLGKSVWGSRFARCGDRGSRFGGRIAIAPSGSREGGEGEFEWGCVPASRL